MLSTESAIQYARTQHDRYLAEFKDFLSIPSVSTLPEHVPDIHRAAEWVAAQLRAIGMENARILETAPHAGSATGHPVVYADHLHAPGQPTVLVFGHYDVQPVDPLDEWLSDPYGGDIRAGNIFARGASDMKGPVHATLKAVEAAIKNGGPGVNVKYLIEGEEEIGSPNLLPFV